MCLHLPVRVHYYRACSGADTWPRDALSLVTAVHYVQVSGSHKIQLCRTGMPPASLILPEHHHVVLPPPLLSVMATGLTRAIPQALLVKNSRVFCHGHISGCLITRSIYICIARKMRA